MRTPEPLPALPAPAAVMLAEGDRALRLPGGAGEVGRHGQDIFSRVTSVLGAGGPREVARCPACPALTITRRAVMVK